MVTTLFFDFIGKTFPALVTSIAEKLNDKRGQLSYLYRDLLTPEYSVDGRWASILAKNSRVTADVISLDSSLPIKSRDSVEVVNGEIPKMGMKMYMTENQMKAADALIAQNATGRFTEPIFNTIFQDVPRCIESIHERIEALLQSEMSSGVGVAEKSTGTAVRIDLNFQNDHKFGVGARWNTSSGKAIDDLQKVFDKADADGNVITDIYADDTWLKEFYGNDQVKTQFAFNQGYVGTNVPVLSFEQAADVVARRFGVTLHRVARTFRNELNGKRTNTKSWANGVASFVCDQKIGSLVWTNTVESVRPVEGVLYQTVDNFILVSKYAENDPWREYTSSQAMVVPIINNVDRIYLLDSQTVQA